MSGKEKLHTAITVAWMVIIFIQSAMPGELSEAESNFIEEVGSLLTGTDGLMLSFSVRKVAHFIEYMVLGGLLMINVRDFGRIFWLAWGIGVLYAVTDEVHQMFVPGRACALMDIGIDAVGVAVGVLIVAQGLRVWTEK